MLFDQAEYDLRCEWGENGVRELSPVSDAVIVVDVMSFSTCVSVAVSRGAMVYPYNWNNASALEFATSRNAELAGPRGVDKYSLSPVSLLDIPPGTRLVLPSPNGSTLALAAGSTPTFAGCLRNSRAVAEAALACGSRVSVIPAGEHWQTDDSLRPAVEDLIGAGAILRHLSGSLSPEAALAVAAFTRAASSLLRTLSSCSSGKQLIAGGWTRDIATIAKLDVDSCAPVLENGAFVTAI